MGVGFFVSRQTKGFRDSLGLRVESFVGNGIDAVVVKVPRPSWPSLLFARESPDLP